MKTPPAAGRGSPARLLHARPKADAGVMATALYPNLKNPDLAFSRLAFDLLPVGLRGLILAAVAAAILSSLEAILNSAFTLFTMDFVKSLKPGASARRPHSDSCCSSPPWSSGGGKPLGGGRDLLCVIAALHSKPGTRRSS